MTLTEAIKHCEDVADYDCFTDEQRKCSEEHRQLADWLKELKERREKDMEDKWITIDFKNGETCHYAPSEYTDYQYDGKYFIVIYEKQWIGMYNLKEIRYIEIASVEDAERGNAE